MEMRAFRVVQGEADRSAVLQLVGLTVATEAPVVTLLDEVVLRVTAGHL